MSNLPSPRRYSATDTPAASSSSNRFADTLCVTEDSSREFMRHDSAGRGAMQTHIAADVPTCGLLAQVETNSVDHIRPIIRRLPITSIEPSDHLAGCNPARAKACSGGTTPTTCLPHP